MRLDSKVTGELGIMQYGPPQTSEAQRRHMYIGCPGVYGHIGTENELHGMGRGKQWPKKPAADGSNKYKSRVTFYICTIP